MDKAQLEIEGLRAREHEKRECAVSGSAVSTHASGSRPNSGGGTSRPSNVVFPTKKT
jgi:hypothetical protein